MKETQLQENGHQKCLEKQQSPNNELASFAFLVVYLYEISVNWFLNNRT